MVARRTLIALSVAAALGFPAAAPALDLAAGVKAGGGYASLAGADYRGYLDTYEGVDRFRLQAALGGFLTVGLMEFLEIQTELLYTYTGAAYEVEATALAPSFAGTIRRSISVSYLEIPVLARLRLGGLSLFAGPDLFIRIGSGRYRQKASDPAVQAALEAAGTDEAEFGRNELKPLFFTATMGAAINMGIGRSVFSLEGRYSLGLQPFHSDRVDPSFIPVNNEFSLRGITVMVNLGHGFGF
jgi:hypothetical protein